MLKTPFQIPEHLETFSFIKVGILQAVRGADKFNSDSEQELFLTRKTIDKPARCSGCLEPGAINITDHRLKVTGLLFLERDNRVVKTNIRF